MNRKTGISILVLLLLLDIIFFIKGDKIIVSNSMQDANFWIYIMIATQLFSQTILFINFVYPSFIQDNKKWLKENKVSFFFYSALIVGCFLFFIDYKGNNLTNSDFWNNVLVEAHGMFMDILLFGIVLTAYERFTNKINESQKMQDEIDDFRYWKSDESKFRIRGNLFRLNKNGVTKIDLAYIDLSEVELRKINLSNSNLLKTNFSNSNMENSNFEEITCSGSKFNGKHAFLLNANFKNANLQYSEFIGAYLGSADFSNAKLSNINFSKADMRGVNFQNAYLYEPNFEGAEVSYDFIAKLPEWKIEGYSITKNYRVVKSPVLAHPGYFQYFLQKIV